MAQTSYSSDDEQPAVIKSATSARQGMWGRHVLWVLIISFTLAAVALLGSWAMQAGNLASTQPSASENKAEAQTYNNPEPTAKQNP